MFGWFRKWREKHETVEEVYQKRGVDISGVGQMVAGTQGIALPPVHRARRYGTPISKKTETPPPSPNNDFLTGFLVAEALSGGNAEAGLIGGAIGGVAGGIIAGELIDQKAPDSVTFGGGESGGAGASGSFDSPSCDTSSSDSSSSSCDSSSSDSGSSSTDF